MNFRNPFLTITMLAVLGVVSLGARAQIFTYQVTLSNLTPNNSFDAASTILPPKAPIYRAKNDVSTQPFTQPVFATHSAGYTMWRDGQSASSGVQSVAEHGLIKQPGNFGNPAFLVGELASHQASNGGDGSVFSIVEVPNPNFNPSNQWRNKNGDAPPSFVPPFPITNWVPSQSAVTFNIMTDAAHPFLSAEFMLVRTNDGFTGLDSLNLLSLPGGSGTFDLFAYDAGTEINSELETDLVYWNSTPSGHPAQTGVIALHSGIQGLNNGFLSPYAWNTLQPVGRINITAVPEPGAFSWILTLGASAAAITTLRRLRKRRK